MCVSNCQECLEIKSGNCTNLLCKTDNLKNNIIEYGRRPFKRAKKIVYPNVEKE